MLRAQADEKVKAELQQVTKLHDGSSTKRDFNTEEYVRESRAGYAILQDLVFLTLSEFTEAFGGGGLTPKDLQLPIETLDLGGGPVQGVMLKEKSGLGTRVRSYRCFDGVLSEVVFDGETQLRQGQAKELAELYEKDQNTLPSRPRPVLTSIQDMPKKVEELRLKREREAKEKEDAKLEAEAEAEKKVEEAAREPVKEEPQEE